MNVWNSAGGHQPPGDATERVRTLDTHVRELAQTMKGAQLKGSTPDENKRNKLNYHNEDSVTVNRTEEEADRTAVTNFGGESLHPGYAIDKGGLHC